MKKKKWHDSKKVVPNDQRIVMVLGIKGSESIAIPAHIHKYGRKHVWSCADGKEQNNKNTYWIEKSKYEKETAIK